MTPRARRLQRRGLAVAMVGMAAWHGLGTPAGAQLVTSMLTLCNASSGTPLGGSVPFTGVMAAGDPDAEPFSMLFPIVRSQLDYGLIGLSAPRLSMQAQGDLSAAHGTIPLSRLRWHGAGIDANGSRWTATGSTANPTDQPLGTSPTPFGLSPLLQSTFYYDMRFQLANSWLTPYGTYATTLTYSVQDLLISSPPQHVAATIDVPARLGLSVPSTAFSLSADPAEPGLSTSGVTVTLKSNARPAELTRLKLRATPLMDGARAIPFADYHYRLGAADPAPLAATDQTVAAFSGASAGTAYTLRYGVRPSWAHAPGRYTSTLTYTAEHGAGAAPDRQLDATTITVEVPPRLFIGLDQGAVTLTADPGDTSADNIARGAAALTVRSNYGQARVYVQASPPTSSTGALPVAALQFLASSTRPPIGGVAAAAGVALHRGDGSWAPFATGAEAIATLTGRTDGAVLTYDYRAQRSWQFPEASYATTVTYTVVGL